MLGFQLRTASKETSKGWANPTFIILNLYVPICCTVNVSNGMNGFSPISLSVSVYLRPNYRRFHFNNILYEFIQTTSRGFTNILNSHEDLDFFKQKN